MKSNKSGSKQQKAPIPLKDLRPKRDAKGGGTANAVSQQVAQLP